MFIHARFLFMFSNCFGTIWMKIKFIEQNKYIKILLHSKYDVSILIEYNVLFFPNPLIFI